MMMKTFLGFNVIFAWIGIISCVWTILLTMMLQSGIALFVVNWIKFIGFTDLRIAYAARFTMHVIIFLYRVYEKLQIFEIRYFRMA